ncbi:MAG: glycosyltransferase family 2 protein [Lachnospiraceae bacterium]|nr:glycosyltransferase family 2 protein [Lachnospiraceae bacterium]
MDFITDSTYLRKNKLYVVGWAAGNDPDSEIELRVYHGKKEVPFRATWSCRPDVGYAMFNDPMKSNLGFFLEIPCKGYEIFTITANEMENGVAVDSISAPVGGAITLARNTKHAVRDFRERNRYITDRVINHFFHANDMKYARFFHVMRAHPYELSEERSAVFENEPLISILVPVYRTPGRYLREMIDSVLAQTYQNFELVIVNADPSFEEDARILRMYAEMDPRVRVKDLPDNLGIAENTNAALELASGEFIAMLDHDDTLERDALYEIVKKLNEEPETDLLYTDEDKIRDRSYYYFYPNFKPDFNPDLLLRNNYICHFLVVRTELARKAGGWDSAFNGAQDYDFILRCLSLGAKAAHVQKPLYHWRSTGASTSGGHQNKAYAADAGKRAIESFMEREGYEAHTEETSVGGWYDTQYELKKTPLVTVLIPNKDHTDDLDKCLRSLRDRCTYQALEIIVIENNSTEEETFRYYERLKTEMPEVRVIYWDKGFNFSAINNYGFRESHGEYILLLNNDTEFITEDAFERMLGHMERPEIGAVGVRLLYDDRTVQHAGVLVGGGGLADHPFKGKPDRYAGYMCRSVTTQDVSCATAACLLVRRSVYEEVGGLDEELEVAFNDVDFCLKIRKAGYLIVYDADVRLFHYESKSRGSENTPEKFLRFGRESALLSTRWGILVSYEDPYYNPNLSYLHYYELDREGMDRRLWEVSGPYKDAAFTDNARTDAEETLPLRLRSALIGLLDGGKDLLKNRKLRRENEGRAEGGE